MRKNKIMRFASLILVLTLLSTSVISGTFAKYTTTAEGSDSARVAVWGINADAVTMDLFTNTYDGTVNANDGDDLIAPGTTKTSNFSIVNTATLAPEVDYNVTIDLTGSTIADSIKNNPDIVWKLDDGAFGTWGDLMTAILRLSGDTTVEYVAGTTEKVTKKYEANAIPTEFANGETHGITWEWKYEDAGKTAAQDELDTTMGNDAVSGDIEVELVVSITATQID